MRYIKICQFKWSKRTDNHGANFCLDEFISAECSLSVTNRDRLSIFIMCVSEAFSLRLLANQGNPIDTPFRFLKIHISNKSHHL